MTNQTKQWQVLESDDAFWAWWPWTFEADDEQPEHGPLSGPYASRAEAQAKCDELNK